MCLDRSLREEAATLLTHDAPVEFRDGHLVKDLLRSRNLEHYANISSSNYTGGCAALRDTQLSLSLQLAALEAPLRWERERLLLNANVAKLARVVRLILNMTPRFCEKWAI